MYPVSNAFLTAVKANTRKYYWTGRITTTAGTVYDFDQEDMVKGSGYITSQCCGSTEIELGTVYARMGDLAEKVTKALGGTDKPVESEKPEDKTTIKWYRVRKSRADSKTQKAGQGSKAGLGRLKSGVGWISLDFVKRV